MNKKNKQIMAVVMTGLVGLSGMAGVGLYSQSLINEKVNVINEQGKVIVDLINRAPEIEYVNVTADPVIEYVNVTETIEVDNENLELVLDHIYDNAGNVEYLLDDLDDDEVEMIADRIIFVNDIKAMAINEVKKNLFDELDNEEIVMIDNSTYEFDDKDLERLRIDDDSDELIIEDIDFEDKDAEVKVSFRFEDDDGIEFEGTCIAVFKDNEFDELEDIEVVERS